MKETGKEIGMEDSAVSGLARRFEEELKTTCDMKKMADKSAREAMKRRMLKEKIEKPGRNKVYDRDLTIMRPSMEAS